MKSRISGDLVENIIMPPNIPGLLDSKKYKSAVRPDKPVGRHFGPTGLSGLTEFSDNKI
jgi:hypothetical protein